jgi:hypothetical protein
MTNVAESQGEGEHGAEQPGRVPQAQPLPAHLVERICRLLRLAGLPLAVETGDAGLHLERAGAVSGPADHVVLSWHVTDQLFDACENELSRHAADRLVSATCLALEEAVEKILSTGGLVLARHPGTRSLTVTAAPDRRPAPWILPFGGARGDDGGHVPHGTDGLGDIGTTIARAANRQ